MIVTTTNNVDGKNVKEYKGIVFGEVISGVNFIKDISASFRNIFGGRSQSYEEELIYARENAIAEMTQRAEDLGANAVLSVDVDYEVLGSDGANMLLVTASGTAVVVE